MRTKISANGSRVGLGCAPRISPLRQHTVAPRPRSRKGSWVTAAAQKGVRIASVDPLDPQLAAMVADDVAEAADLAAAAAPAAADLDPMPYSGPTTKVKFTIDKPCEFGQHLNIIGAHPLLGEWQIEDSVPMDWVEGTKWEVTLTVPHFELIEYKYVVRSGWDPDGPAIWQGGPNFILATNQCSEMVINDNWVHDAWPDNHPIATAASAAVQVYADTHPRPKYAKVNNLTAVPEWAENAVFYQIFPLGFFGAPSLNIGDEAPMVPRLALITKHLDYMQSLGVTVAYFSPLFESDTHGYDTADYFQIDRRLGDVDLFKKIVKQCHARGLKVVLDGVFNHTGRRHFAFLDLAEKGPDKSAYANWYHVGARPDDYEGYCSVTLGDHGFSYDCWEGHAMLPRLNLAEPAVREHIFEAARYWLTEIGIDGWRLDVAHEISPDFWYDFRRVCLEAAPDCLLVGEMIHGNYNNWVSNDHLHSGTNYQLSRAIWNSLNEQNYDELMTALLREDKLYRGLTLMNFLGNHDVARLASTLIEPKHFVHANATMMLLPGMPCLYYGDELGMEGRPGEGDDEACGGDDAMRRPMLSAEPDETWPESAPWRLEVTRKLAKIKRTVPAFATGVMDVQRCVFTPTTFIFIRETPEQKAVVVLNSAPHDAEPWPECEVPPSMAKEGAIFKDIYNEDMAPVTVTNGMLYVECPALTVRVLVHDVPPPPKPKPVVTAAATAGAPVAGAPAAAAPVAGAPPAAATPASPAPPFSSTTTIPGVGGTPGQ